MNKLIRKLAALCATAVLAGSMTAAPAQAAAHCAGTEQVNLYTFKVNMKSAKKSYTLGQTATINVEVLRPADEDPLGMHQPMPPVEKHPVEGANIGVGLRAGDVFLFGVGTTNADGKAAVKIKIQTYAEPGEVNVDALAYKVIHQNVCMTVQEFGYASVPSMFTVTK
jgi:hypothetical protein